MPEQTLCSQLKNRAQYLIRVSDATHLAILDIAIGSKMDRFKLLGK